MLHCKRVEGPQCMHVVYADKGSKQNITTTPLSTADADFKPLTTPGQQCFL